MPPGVATDEPHYAPLVLCPHAGRIDRYCNLNENPGTKPRQRPLEFQGSQTAPPLYRVCIMESATPEVGSVNKGWVDCRNACP